MAENEVADAPEFETEEVWFRKDGTTILRIDGKRYTLRRPKFKELRRLRESGAALDKELNDRLEAPVARVEEIREAIGIDPETGRVDAKAATEEQQAELRALNDQARDIREEHAVVALGWFRDEILGPLSGKSVENIDPEDLPAWCADLRFIKELNDHWSSVPRRPGVA